MRICVLVFFLAALSVAAEESLPDARLAALPSSAALSQDTPEKVKLGRLLFFDPILSATREVACATCHHPRFGWADGRTTPLGVHAMGLGPERKPLEKIEASTLTRNTPSILNAAFNGLRLDEPHDPAKAPMFWDNRVESLEAQVLAPIRSREEMRGDACSEAEAVPQMIERLKAVPEYRKLFGGEITPEKVADAIAAFERTLITPETPFDRFMRGERSAMNASQQRGMEAFQRAGCALCHNGPMLSDFKMHAIGLSGPPLRTPTLRNLRHTTPYLHDGSQRTLEDVMLFYDRLMDHAAETLDGGDKATLPPLDPLLSRLDMRPEDHEPILDFLDALSSDDYDRSVPERVPSGLP
ncbi:MAG: cytochrome-c peroxidase [Prosthecobacter sp.]